jgi:beta-phosphoglucomutase
MTIRAYLFDMDGTLCDSEDLIAEAACRMFRETYGVEPVPSDFAPFVGTGEDRYLGGVAKQYGVNISLPRDKDVTYRLYADMAREHLRPIPGAIEFVRAASRDGLLLAVATSADPFKLGINLDGIRLEASLFQALITGDDIQHKKPAPDIFLKAAERLGVDPAECRVFEDAVTGVQAAKAAGMHCIGITSFFDAATLLAAGADETWPDFTAAVQTPPAL